MDAALDNRSPNLHAIPLAPLSLQGIDHGFFGRIGGVSTGVFRSFNLSRWIGDDPDAVTRNWRIWLEDHPSMIPAFVKQVHGNQVRTVDDKSDSAREPADGMVTAVSGIALCIFTADCVPVLLADRENRVVGALHAGWRGTLSDIVAQGIRAMIAQGARYDSLHAALGPAIGPCCFEVDQELADRFAHTLPYAVRHTRTGVRGKAYLDLRAIVALQLADAGLNPGRIQITGPCTKCDHERYYSRRAAAGATTGLQMSFIGLAG